MPVIGVMPMGSEPPTHASCAWWLVVVVFLQVVARNQRLLDRSSLLHPVINKVLVKSLICRSSYPSFSALEAVEVTDPEWWRSGWLILAVWVCAYQRWSSRRRCWRLQMRMMAGRRRHTTASDGRRAAFSFPPGQDAIREAVLWLPGRHGFSPWLPCRPKWLVPRRRRGVSGVVTEDPIAFYSFSLGSFLQMPRGLFVISSLVKSCRVMVVLILS